MYQCIELIGNLGGDPEMRYTPAGIAVTNFSIATTTKVSKEKTPNCPEGWVESYNGKAWEFTTWWRITAWRGLAETCNQFLEKGKQVFVKGEMHGTIADGKQYPRIWQTSDGEPRANFEVTARMVKFVGARGSGGGGGTPTPDEPPPNVYEENDIPF